MDDTMSPAEQEWRELDAMVNDYRERLSIIERSRRIESDPKHQLQMSGYSVETAALAEIEMALDTWGCGEPTEAENMRLLGIAQKMIEIVIGQAAYRSRQNTET